jgi:hypothetical protein
MGFLNIAFLVGLVAAAVPIIIHLLNRRRVKRVKFSSLEFLDEVNKQRMRRINLQRILILILRTLAILALVFAFARPTLRSGLLFAGSVPKNVVVCLDASFSMGVAMEKRHRLRRRQEIASDVVNEANGTDVINVVAFAKNAEALLEQGTRNKGVVKSTIERVVLSSETTSIQRGRPRARRDRQERRQRRRDLRGVGLSRQRRFHAGGRGEDSRRRARVFPPGVRGRHR